MSSQKAFGCLRDLEDFMEQSGFWPIRAAKASVIYFDGVTRVSVPDGAWRSNRGQSNLRADVKRAIRARPGGLLDAHPNAITPLQRGLEYQAQLKKKEEEKMSLRAKMAELSDFSKLEKAKTAGIPVESPEPLKIVAAPPVPSIEPEAPVKKARKPRSTPERIRRFSAAARFAVWSRIEQIFKAGCTDAWKIADRLWEENFRMSNGDKIDTLYVQDVVRQCREEWLPKARPRAETVERDPQHPTPIIIKKSPEPKVSAEVVPAPEAGTAMLKFSPLVQQPTVLEPDSKLPAFVLALLTDPKMVATKKLLMLANYVKVSKGRVPEIVASLVEDQDLSAEEKVAMLMGFVEL